MIPDQTGISNNEPHFCSEMEKDVNQLEELTEDLKKSELEKHNAAVDVYQRKLVELKERKRKLQETKQQIEKQKKLLKRNVLIGAGVLATGLAVGAAFVKARK